MNTYGSGFIFVLVSTVLAIVGMLLVRRKFGVETLNSFHEVAGYLLSIIGTLYAVLLGFVIVDAMERQQELRVMVEQEANGVADVYQLANGLDDPLRKSIQKHCHDYVQSVIDDEWQAMNDGTFSPKSQISMWHLWKELTEMQPKSTAQQTIHDKLLDQLPQVANNRRIRLISAVHGIPAAMWVILIVGGVFTVVFTYFFAVENLKVQLVMTTLVTLTLTLNVLLVFLYGTPFSGELAVRPDAFKLDLIIFKHWEEGMMPEAKPLSVIMK